MRIVVLLTSLFTGGAEFSTLTFYGWLRQQGYDVKIICLKKATPSYRPEQFGLDDVTTLSGSKWKKWKALNEIVSVFRPQVIHSVLFEANILGRFVKYANPGITHLESLVNEVYSDQRLNDPNVTWIKLKSYQCFDFVTQLMGVDHYHANGYSVASHYEKKLFIGKKRISVIPRGRKPNKFLGDMINKAKVRGEFGVTNDELLLINVGRHEFQKGQDTLLEALAHMGPENRYKCVIVGREGKFTSNLKQIINDRKLQQKVILAGHRENVNELLAASDIFVFPSRFEGLPGALIEAEAAALPIVCSDIGNNKEVVEEDENALIFPTNDAEALSQKISTLVADVGLRKMMSEKSLVVFEEKFLLDAVHMQMKKLIDSFRKS